MPVGDAASTARLRRDRAAARRTDLEAVLARVGDQRIGHLDARAAALIRLDGVWLAVEPLDMRAGTETALARVVAVIAMTVI